MRAAILGLGIITPFGVGVERFWQGLRGQIKPDYAAEAQELKTHISPAMLRRMDPLAQKALLCSILALKDADIFNESKNIGIVTGSGYGCLNASFSFQDSLIDYGDSAPSPTDFINSVHNALSAQVSIALKIQGPVTTISTFELTTAQSLETADSWLNHGFADYVLVCIGDENHPLRNYAIAQLKSNLISDNLQYEPGEFFVSFLLSKEGTAKYGYLQDIQSGGIDGGCSVQYAFDDSELFSIESICGYSACVDALYLSAAAVMKQKQMTLNGRALGLEDKIIIKRGKDTCLRNYMTIGGK